MEHDDSRWFVPFGPYRRLTIVVSQSLGPCLSVCL